MQIHSNQRLPVRQTRFDYQTIRSLTAQQTSWQLTNKFILGALRNLESVWALLPLLQMQHLLPSSRTVSRFQNDEDATNAQNAAKRIER
jgi:hypothetical protein